MKASSDNSPFPHTFVRTQKHKHGRFDESEVTEVVKKRRGGRMVCNIFGCLPIVQSCYSQRVQKSLAALVSGCLRACISHSILALAYP